MPSASHPALRVIVVDDRPAYREGLRAILAREASMAAVGEAATAAEALAIAKTAKPDVAIVKEMVDGVSGFVVARQLRQTVPECQVLILALGDVSHLAEDTRATGAAGYLHPRQSAAGVVDAIETAFRAKRFVAADRPAPPRPDSVTLSQREREIFGLAVGGFSNNNIAQHLEISVKTVETHRAHINRKLGVHSTAELVRFAAKHGLIPP